MPKLQVFDPAMCCPTGVCGPAVDPALVRFSADLDWLTSVGIQVERFSLSQEPAAFVANAAVAEAMRGRDDALPLLLLDGKIVAQGSYPERAALAALAGVSSAARGAEGAPPRACCPPPDTTPVGLGGSTSKKCC